MTRNKKLRNPLAYVRVIDKIYLPEEYDRRRKLTKAQHAEIKAKYKKGLFSQRDLANIYGVALGTIARLVSELAKIQQAEAGKRWRLKNKKKPYDSMDIRRRKKELIKKGIIKL